MSTDDKLTLSYEDLFYDDLRDPEYCIEYLKLSFAEAVEEKDFRGFLVSVHHAIKANGLSKSKVAKDAGLSRQHLYRIFNGESVPSFDKVIGLLMALGVNLSISAVEEDS